MNSAHRLVPLAGIVCLALGAAAWIHHGRLERREAESVLQRRNAERIGNLLDRCSLDSASRELESLVSRSDSTHGLTDADRERLQDRLQGAINASDSCRWRLEGILGNHDTTTRTWSRFGAPPSCVESNRVCRAVTILAWIRSRRPAPEIDSEIDLCAARWPSEPGFRVLRGIHLLMRNKPREAVPRLTPNRSDSISEFGPLVRFGDFQALWAARTEPGMPPIPDSVRAPNGREGFGAGERRRECRHDKARLHSAAALFWAWSGDSARMRKARDRQRSAWNREESHCIE